MNPIILYLFVALVQGHGYIAAHSSTLEECEETRSEAMKSEDILMMSDCQSMTISPVAKKEPTKIGKQ